MVTTIGAILTIAKMLNPDIVDEDPRSTNFGKIKIFGYWTDITGGMASLVTLAARLIPSQHNGEWGSWYKSSSGNYKNLRGGEFGQTDAWEIFTGFLGNKLSPAFGLLRDYLKAKTFDGDPVTIPYAIESLTQPIPYQTFKNLMENKETESVLGSLILESLGFSVSIYSVTQDNWENRTSKEMKQFKEDVGKDKFKEANDRYNELYYEWFSNTGKTQEYRDLSEDGKKDLVSKAKQEIKEQVFKEYRFKYKKSKKTSEERKEEKTIDKLLPN